MSCPRPDRNFFDHVAEDIDGPINWFATNTGDAELLDFLFQGNVFLSWLNEFLLVEEALFIGYMNLKQTESNSGKFLQIFR